MENIIIKALLGYIEKHPEVIEKLIEALVERLITAIKNPKTPAAPAA